MGGELSIEEAYEKWADDLLKYAAALNGPTEAADVVAEAFAGVLDRGSAAWNHIGDHRGYLFRVVLNTVRMRERGRSRRERRERRLWEPQYAWDLLADPAVMRAVRGLSVQQRAVTFLTYWEDLAPTDVATTLGVSEGTVKRQLARARATLREVLR